jgi:hypothetical protein
MRYQQTKNRITRNMLCIAAAFALAMNSFGCADTLLTSEGFAGKPPGGALQVATTTVDLGNGLFETNIDAASYTNWVYYNFETGQEVSVADPASDSIWDIALQRFVVKLNGGASGNAGATVVALTADNFTARTQAPGPFAPELTDVLDPGDGNDACRPTTTGVLFAFLRSIQNPNACWFAYSVGVLTPRDMVYVVKTATPRYYKIKMLNYYGPTGTSGKIRFQWGEVCAP